MPHRKLVGPVGVSMLLASCWALKEPGYSPQNPTEIVCGCHDGQSCYEGASSLAAAKGETPETAETLMYYAQCACFQGSMAGCNTLSHFARDGISDCERGRNVAHTCTVMGMVFLHGVRAPRLTRSYGHDPARAKEAFTKACKAGSQVACQRI